MIVPFLEGPISRAQAADEFADTPIFTLRDIASGRCSDGGPGGGCRTISGHTFHGAKIAIFPKRANPLAG